MEIAKIIPALLFASVGIISLVMAFKCLLSGRYLPFHEKGTGKPWVELEPPLQHVILSMLRLGGLGFLIVSVLLLVFPAFEYFYPNNFYRLAIPAVAFMFCSGLFINNYLLFRHTKADTPWKGSLVAVFAIIAGMIISLFN